MSVSLQLLIQFFSSAVLKKCRYLNDFQRVSRRCLEGAPGHVNGISINTSSFSIMLFNYCLMPVLHCIGLNILNSAFFSFIGAHQFFLLLNFVLEELVNSKPKLSIMNLPLQGDKLQGNILCLIVFRNINIVKRTFPLFASHNFDSFEKLLCKGNILQLIILRNINILPHVLVCTFVRF